MKLHLDQLFRLKAKVLNTQPTNAAQNVCWQWKIIWQYCSNMWSHCHLIMVSMYAENGCEQTREKCGEEEICIHGVGMNTMSYKIVNVCHLLKNCLHHYEMNLFIWIHLTVHLLLLTHIFIGMNCRTFQWLHLNEYRNVLVQGERAHQSKTKFYSTWRT